MNNDKILKSIKDYFLLFLRSFFLQAGWNYDRKQAFGFAFILYPYIKRLYPDSVEQKNALLRHLEFFNSHPCLSNAIIGTTIGLEERRAKEGSVNIDLITNVKTQMAGPLAALGDTLFWSTWRPITSIIAIVFYFIFGDKYPWLPVITFLFLYNIVHLPIRYIILKKAYREQTKFIVTLNNLKPQKWIDILHLIGIALILGLVTYIIFGFQWQANEIRILMTFFIVSVVLTKFQVSQTKIFYLAIITGILCCYFKLF